MNKSNCTLLVNSCDKYTDILDVFFKLLNRYWPDLPYDIVLSTESTEYKNPNFNIRNIHPNNKNCSWTERISETLEKINSDYVILLLDDFFLYNRVNTKKIEKCLSWMKNNKKITSFTFWPMYCDCDNTKYEGFAKRKKVSRFKVAAIAGMWRKEELLKYTKNYNENIWEWERNATIRSNTKYKNDQFYIMLNSQDEIIPYDFAKYGLFSGKWLKDTIELFKKNKINFDFSKRGIFDQSERSLSSSIKASFEMESSIIAHYDFNYKGSSFKAYKRKFNCGYFEQTYKIRGASNVICWQPSILWGFYIEKLNIKVIYMNSMTENINISSCFGNYAIIDGKVVFNNPDPSLYIETKEKYKIKKVIISGLLNLIDDKNLSSETYGKTTFLNNKQQEKNIHFINLEKILSKEKIFYVNINPEVIFLDKNNLEIKRIIDKKVSKKGNFEYIYNISRNCKNIKWSPSFMAGFKINKFKVIQLDDKNKKIKTILKDINGVPKYNIYLDKVFINIPIYKNTKKIIIKGKMKYPIKRKELGRAIR